MSYESVVVIFIVFMIPAGIYLATRIIHLRQDQKDKQAQLDYIFSTHKKDTGRITF